MLKHPYFKFILIGLALSFIVLLSGCNVSNLSLPWMTPTVDPNILPTATRVVVVVPKAPTATNFPRLGTATPVPPTPTPKPTETPNPFAANTAFADETLEEMMVGTIEATGLEASVDIVDERASGGERIANIVLVTDQDLESSNLLLKLFVLEVGNALRSVRVFGEGTLNADLDGMALTVVDRENTVVGTVAAPMSEINAFLRGELTVNEALDRLNVTGIFETFK